VGRLLPAALLLYLATVGATFNGVLALPATQPVTLALFGLVAAGMLLAHRRYRLPWHTTPLDAIFPLWGAAWALSIVASPDTWRRSAEALWYMGLYIAVWYVLCDTLAQGLRRAHLLRALLITGLVVLFFGGVQVLHTLTSSGELPRPASLIGNPNALGAFLVALLPAAVSGAITAGGWLRRLLALYSLATLLLLLITFSRGAWLGAGAALLTLAALWLWQRGLHRPAALRDWLAGRTAAQRRTGLLLAVGALAGAVLAGGLLLQSFNEGGRQASLRLYLWEAALRLFAEKPLTGHGLFTFGYHLPRFDAIPPGQPHSHAHSIPLSIAAETGLPGLLALALTVAVLLWHLGRNARTLPPEERPAWLAAVAALAGFGVHHLLDTPAMMPLIALVGVGLAAVAAAPAQPVPLRAPWRRVGHPAGMALLWAALLLVGFWSSSLYGRYYGVLQTALRTGAYAAAAAELTAIREADPRQPAYVLMQAYLYGLAAADGDAAAARQAAAGYDEYLRLEPYHSSAWVNRAALAWQAGDTPTALAAIDRALALSPAYGFSTLRDLYTGTRIPTEDGAWGPPLWALNGPRFQYLREVIEGEFLPQVGWYRRR
jgi:putative inorganic carbon (HCO3(-)) transporter